MISAPLQDDDIRKYSKTTRNGIEFNHYYINGEKSDSGIDHIKIQEALNKYKNLVISFLSKFTALEWQDLKESMPF